MDAPTIHDLLLENQHLREQLAQRDRLIEQLHQTVRGLQQRLEAVSRSVKRQAAPFSKGEPKKRPKKPGRKKGDRHGQHGHRPPPPPDHVDETVEATLPPQCPDCGGTVVEDKLDHQYQTEIPRQPIIRQINIHCGHCQNCGKTLRGRHPLQTSDATGAAQSQLGPDAQAAVAFLNKRVGMSHGKIADTFAKLFGISLCRGASAQIVLRTADRLQPARQEIVEHLIDSDHITPDETGWRIGGHAVWLHGWVGDDGATLYAIDPQRSAEVLANVIGVDWWGSMTHDGFSSYGLFEDVVHQQCCDHALRRARTMLEHQTGAATRFPRQVIDLFTAALQTRERLNDADADYEQRDRVYQDYTDRLLDLTERTRQHEGNARFAKHLRNHANDWFIFLVDRTIPATNHRAEQALKTPIVNRKVWGGNRTDAGGDAQATISSVLETCKQRAINVVQYFSNTLCGTVGALFT